MLVFNFTNLFLSNFHIKWNEFCTFYTKIVIQLQNILNGKITKLNSRILTKYLDDRILCFIQPNLTLKHANTNNDDKLWSDQSQKVWKMMATHTFGKQEWFIQLVKHYLPFKVALEINKVFLQCGERNERIKTFLV